MRTEQTVNMLFTINAISLYNLILQCESRGPYTQVLEDSKKIII